MTWVLVLHGHLPWVLNHGRWPHGEDWLFEAASETWLPLLGVLDRCAAAGLRPGWSVGLTPVLLEQLGAAGFRERFVHWLRERRDQAERDERDFNAWGQGDLAWVAARWRERLDAQLEDDPDVIARFRAHADAGRVALLGSVATHAYLPLLLNDRSVTAQIRVGLRTSERHLGARPRAVWLPECAYRPPGPFHPPAVHAEARDREGTATLLAAEGVRAFVVDHGTWGGEPVEVLEGGPTGVAVVGRAFDVAERVWSADHGYPGDGRYLEFHKRHDTLRYWRVTRRGADLGSKEPYDPDAAALAVEEHAEDFVRRVRERRGVVCTPFDAELFGHWWHEGPEFLWEVAKRMEATPLEEALKPTRAVALPEGSWGAGGDHRVWLGEHVAFYWDLLYRAEDRFLGLVDRTRGSLLAEAGRQLLLLQASDWPFVVASGGAHDYGTRRVHEHAARFDDLCLGVEDVLAGRPPTPIAEATRAWCAVADPVFPDLDLDGWC